MPTLLAASAVVSPPRRPFDDSPGTLSYYRDLVGPFGLDVDEELLRSAPHVRHQDLLDLLAGADGIRDFAPDLVVVAHALPDLTPFTAIAPYLDHLLGGGSVNFGVHQQGLAAPFTALRAVSAFQRGRRSERAVLAVLEQTTLPTRFPLVHDHGLVDSGVLLALGTDGGPRVAGVETVAAARGPAGRLRELTAADPAGTLLVTGPWVDRAALGEPASATYHCDPGTYCTGVWLALARHWRAWRADHSTVVLCDTDPRSGDTHLAVLRSDGGPAAGEEER
ncbi:hypothetical protein [Streptomyces albireticuli]|uniref:Uncharacterized protein n=1 Tax=Streptomyces albireticuli TaxID=1940 RepID=A0A2A2DD27_9ACTN|nr:hypothetical protein [Streptomyces albireticuli]MCD9144997.1 hypothetical protein [Streptomyces albireticuli]MCD9164423.1 hypothetical protein [Streptomyces albireticuli]MCD9194134.1 hypothetical protein [Streptomyces albireticuli]PAU49424.1 hypothetical protein CK936_08200 [Streptomyces albireticuli]